MLVMVMEVIEVMEVMKREELAQITPSLQSLPSRIRVQQLLAWRHRLADGL